MNAAPQQPLPGRRRRRKRPLRVRIIRKLQKSGLDRNLYIALVAIVGAVAALLLYDLLFAVFPMKMK